MSLLIKREDPKSTDENQLTTKRKRGRREATTNSLMTQSSRSQPVPLVVIRIHNLGEYKTRINGYELRCKDSFELTLRLRRTKHH